VAEGEDVTEVPEEPTGRFGSVVKEAVTPLPFVQTEGTDGAFPARNFTAAHFTTERKLR
jgi:hypothetical protein